MPVEKAGLLANVTGRAHKDLAAETDDEAPQED